MHRNHVNDGGDQQQQEEGEMHLVPERKQPFVSDERRYSADAIQVVFHKGRNQLQQPVMVLCNGARALRVHVQLGVNLREDGAVAGPRRKRQRHRQCNALPKALGRFQDFSIVVAENLQQVRYELGCRTDSFRGQLYAGKQLLEVGFSSEQAVVDFLVEEATDQATAGDQQHGNQGCGAVYRAKREIAVVENRERPDDTQDHVDAKPVANLPEELQEAVPLSQRVQQQREYEQAADNAEGVTQSVLSEQAARIATHVPDDHSRGGEHEPGVSAVLLI